MIQTRSERFEMRLEPSILEAIDSWRKDEDGAPSRAEAVRQLIEAGLATKKSKHPQISDGEKLTLLMLCEIKKHLGLTDELEPDFIESVIYGGHYWGLGWKYTGVFHGHSDKEETVREVVDILDMWSFLEEGFKKLSNTDKKRLKDDSLIHSDNLSFSGFDGNNEAEHGSVAGFLIEKLERFSSFKERPHLNSHMPVLDGYRRMLTVFLPIRRTLTLGGGLGFSNIAAILKARRYASTEE